MSNEKKHVSITKAAAMLGIHITTARRWFDCGLLKGFRHPISNFRRVFITSIEEQQSATHSKERVLSAK